MNFTASFQGNLSLLPCSSSAIFSFFTCSSRGTLSFCKFFSRKKKEIVCRVTGTDTEPDNNNDKQINEDGENPPATDTHQKNDKPEPDSKLDDVNQITNNDIETNGLGGGVQLVIVLNIIGLVSICNGGTPHFSWIVSVDWWVPDKKPRHVLVFALCRLSSTDLDSGMYGGVA
ncbi:hypothetical protein Patl1_34545 [Pistacia atlantica]|uniref:Uncharacterized protein n=1 Tax=Pistacia atlantica TaxID=434234 RepID=A0ACC0ZSP5_9ROSI|nr:hypothetical protein Patl1_34545 [Pistacia atlantica]